MTQGHILDLTPYPPVLREAICRALDADCTLIETRRVSRLIHADKGLILTSVRIRGDEGGGWLSIVNGRVVSVEGFCA